jgi:hypothetical protein
MATEFTLLKADLFIYCKCRIGTDHLHLLLLLFSFGKNLSSTDFVYTKFIEHNVKDSHDDHICKC